MVSFFIMSERSKLTCIYARTDGSISLMGDGKVIDMEIPKTMFLLFTFF